jgi:hypothetical protein
MTALMSPLWCQLYGKKLRKTPKDSQNWLKTSIFIFFRTCNFSSDWKLKLTFIVLVSVERQKHGEIHVLFVKWKTVGFILSRNAFFRKNDFITTRPRLPPCQIRLSYLVLFFDLPHFTRTSDIFFLYPSPDSKQLRLVFIKDRKLERVGQATVTFLGRVDNSGRHNTRRRHEVVHWGPQGVLNWTSPCTTTQQT